MISLDDLPARHFATIMADPPWPFQVRSEKGEGRSASRHYGIMSIDAIKAMPVRRLAANDCWLFLWVPSPLLQRSFEVMEAWGFHYSGLGFCYVKTNLDGSYFTGLGFTTRKNVELCLLGRRGSPKRLRKDVRELIVARRREHSRKPEEFYERVQLFAPGPHLELFARCERKGITAWGDQTAMFGGCRGGQEEQAMDYQGRSMAIATEAPGQEHGGNRGHLGSEQGFDQQQAANTLNSVAGSSVGD